MRKLLFGAAFGAVLAYLFDPRAGRGRRAKLADQAAAGMRDAAEETGRQARYQAGRMKGAAHEGLEAVMPEEPLALDDATLLQKVRSEALGPSGLAMGNLEIHVDDGVVIIRGDMAEPGAGAELEERVRAVRGVTGVRNELTHR